VVRRPNLTVQRPGYLTSSFSNGVRGIDPLTTVHYASLKFDEDTVFVLFRDYTIGALILLIGVGFFSNSICIGQQDCYELYSTTVRTNDQKHS